MRIFLIICCYRAREVSVLAVLEDCTPDRYGRAVFAVIVFDLLTMYCK